MNDRFFFILHPSSFIVSFRGVLLGEQRASKTRAQGSNPCTPADLASLPLECDGFARDPPKVADQVRLLARALLGRAPRECVGRTAVFEAARPGPIPGRGTLLASRPRSVTDSHTTLRRSRTRFNSWRGHHFHDAGARRPGDRLQPG
jgi:hypothetical protein